jgi:predicted nuclease of predicted toxin-antitoxin system
MDKWPQLSAKPKTDLMPQNASWKRWDTPIKWDAERQGTPLDENDLWIAATARALEAIVVTIDSDFQRVSGLQTEDWTQ